MIRLELNRKIIFLAVVLSFSVLSVNAANRYSVATGNWNAAATWSATSGGAPGATVPGVNDNAFIEGGRTVTITANAACINLSIANGSVLNVGAFNFPVSGTANVSGTINFTSATGTKSFAGLLTIAATGIWNNNTNNAPVTLNGGITNSGTFNAGTGTYTFNTNGQGLTGTLSIPNITVTGITLTNNGTLTASTTLGGTGGLTQGVNATLNIGGTSAITTLTASNSGNTVNFAGAAQTVNVSSYYNLTISGSGNKTMAGNVTVGGTPTLTAGTFTVGANTLTLNGPTIAGTPANLVTAATSTLVFGGTTAGVLIPTSVAALNGLSISNTNIVTLQSSPTLSGTLDPAGAGLSIGANTLTLNGQINCGTLVGGASSNIIIGGAGTANLPSVTLNNLTVNRAVTMCGNVTVGGTLTLTSGALTIGANTLTLSNGANLTYGAGTLTGGVTSNMIIGTGGAVTLNAVAGGLNNFNTSRNITLGAALSVNGTLTLTAGTFTVGANTLTLNGPTIAGTPANLVTAATSTLVFGGTTAGVLIPTSVAALNGLSISNTNIVTLQSSPTLSGTLDPAGAGLSIGANTLTLNGQINCGILVGGASSNIIIGGAGAANLPSVTLNNLTVNRAVTMCGNVTVGGTLTLTSGALTIGANTLTLSNGSNLTYGAGTLTGGATSNLTIGSGADITLNAIAGGLNNFNAGRNIALGAALSVNGTLTLTAGTFTVGANTLTLNGPTIAGTPANLVTAATSTLVFGGTTAGVLIPTSVAALNGLSISNTNIVTLQSSPTLSGTLDPAGAGLSIGANTLTLNGQINCGTLVGGASSNIIIGGAGTANLPSVTLNNLTVNRAVTMCGNVTVGGTLTLTSGALTIGANTLTLSNGANLTYGAGTLTGGVTSNMIIGTGGAVTLNAVAGGLNNFNTSRNITLGAALSVNGTLTLTAGTFTVGANTLTLNGPTIAGTPANLVTAATSTLVFGGTTAGVLIPTSVAALNGLSISNTNIVTLQSSPTLSGTLDPAGAGLSIGANTLTLNGQINCGTLVGGASSNIIIGGAGAANLPSVTLNNLTVNRAVTMCGNVTVGGTLTLTSGALTIGANTLTLSNGSNLTYGAGTLTGGATSNLTIGSGADITLNAIAGGLNNFNAGRNITLGADLTLNGTLTLTAGTFTVGPRILTLSGPAIAGNPLNLSTAATSTLSFAGSSAGIFIPSSVLNLANLIINNANGVAMNSNITLAAGGVLTLTSGIVQAGANILKILNTNPVAAIVWTPGSFVNITTGFVERTLLPNLVGAGNNYLFPIGEGGVFKGLNLRDVNTGATGPVLRISVSPTGALTGDGTTISSVDPRYWSLLNMNSGNLTSAKIELYESGLNFSKTIGMSSAVSGNYASVGGSSNSSSVISQTVLNPGPYFSIGLGIQDTYYSYQTGDWNSPTTWTSDPSGTLQIGTTVPGDNDKAKILSGRTVSLSANISTQTLDITIDAGGFLDLGIYKFNNGLYALRGQGTIRLASVNFPLTVINTFINAGGGTAEYNNTSGFTLPASQTTYNNLTINTAGPVATQLSNLTLNGNLYIKSGTFQINNNISAVKLTLTINGSVTVDNGASITVGNGVTNTAIGGAGGAAPFLTYYLNFHTVIIKGDFTNNGTVRFTNLPYPLFNAFPPIVAGATSGAASVYFQGTSDNTITCNGITNFYNLILDKGIDQTYKLTINSSNYVNFKLFGANIMATDGAVTNNPNLRKALWIRNGTFVLKGMVIIPSLSEGTAANSDFYIPSNGAMVFDGVDVLVLASADDYREVNLAYSVSAPDNVTIGVTKGGFSAIDIFGKLQVNNGSLSTRESGGLITSNIASGQLIINGGTVDAKQFLSSTGSASYTQTGGLFILRGRFQRTPAAYSTISDLKDFSTATLNTSRATNGTASGFGSFNLEQPTNIFTMSGGIISIYDVCGTAAAEQKAFDVKSSSSNINVLGGAIEIRPTTGSALTDAGSYYINTSASIYDLLINRASSSSVVQLNLSPLVVLNNLNLAAGDFSANNLNVTIGGNFSISAGTSYATGTNTTIFNGTANQTFTVNLATPLTLNRLTIDKPAGTALNLAGTQKTINVADNFRLVLGTLNDNGNIINLAGNVYNSGLHAGTGKVVLNGTISQNIDGNGIFGNLELNNTNAAAAPVSLVANTTVNGVLTFSQDKLFNISTYNLKLNSSASIINGGSLRYLKSAGNAGDGGLTKVFSSPAPFTFPVGVVNYTPGSIGFSTAPAVYGSVTMIPVNYEHPNVTVPGRSLSYFWRVKSSGFTLGPATVTHGYTYSQANVVTGAGITEDEYVAARFNVPASTWTKGTSADVDETNNIIGEPGSGNFLENVSFIDGDYTAGDDNPTNPFGVPAIFYSRQSGLWGDVNTWSLTSHTVTNPPASPPGASDIVIVGNGHTVTFATPANYLTNPDTDPHSCASLQVESGSTLDIRFNPSSKFSLVQSAPGGNGTIRIADDWDDGSTFAFPGGDFSDFNQNLGTTELYSTNAASGTTYWLPNGIGSYGNLVISPLGGSNIIFPNNNLTIFGNLIMKGQNADSWFCPTWSGNYPTPPIARIAKTITVMGDFNIQGGSFGWYGGGGGGAQDIVVNGNVIVAPGAGIDVWSSNTSQSMSIGGNLINNSTNITAGGTTTLSYVNLTQVPVTFFGSTNASITSTAGTPRTDLGSVTINKGTSQATTLTLDIGNILNTQTNNWLTLLNGTFRYMRTNPPAGADFTISTNTAFNIPSTAGLYLDYANANNINVLIGNAANNSGDLILSGKLTLIRGNVYVGPVNSPANNNDIEYSGGGASAIEIQGGSLVVNGQVRRNTATTNGILNYTQSGGTVIINGNGANAGYAKLEVLNAASAFNMSAGTLTIVRGGGTTFGDLFLRPASSSVTGGNIIFSNVIPNTLQNYLLDANVPLNNLTITGAAGAGLNSNVGLIVSPLVLNGTLTLSNARSIFNSNNIDVTISANLDNSGTCNFGTNTTTFNGGTQLITGSSVTNFYNLNVLSANSLTVNKNLSVNNDLIIGTGSLILGNNKLTLAGDLVNNGSFTDDNTTGGISLSGTTMQQINGMGAYGTLEINNSSGAQLNNGIMLQNNLVLTQGIFNIGSNLLTLSQNSKITGVPGITRMIISDGVVGSSGVRKFFTAAPQSFTFPVGVVGKYTPAAFTITSNGTVGYINVKPIDNNHPSVLDPLNVLQYYWQIESSGISGFGGNLLLQYLPGDVAGVESSYVAARLELPGDSWSKSPPGPGTDNVDETNHRITFVYSGSNNLNGDYTAGNFAAIPTEVASYQTNNNGFWSDQSIWTPVGSSPPCPVGGPNGANVIIDHIVTTDVNNIFVINTTINNRLRVIYPTFGHNLGNVDGNGTIYLENGNIPAGNYTSFLDCSGNGTIEYGGSGTYIIIADQFSSLPNMFFTGTGSRILPNKNLTICKRLVIDGPVLDNSVNGYNLTILGTMERYNTGAFISGSGSATVTFSGSSVQTLGGPTGDFAGSNKLNNLEINNSAGLNIGANGLVEVNKQLLLTNGIITTTSTSRLNLLNTYSSAVIPTGGSNTSFINGPLIKQIINGDNFLYPLGRGTSKGHNFTITSSAGSTLFWTVEFFTPNPTSTSTTLPLLVANTKEYWSVSTTTGANAKVKIGWDPASDLTPLMTQNGITDMRVAEYNSGSWNELNSVTSGDNYNGDVATVNNVSITTIPKNYTTASISATIARASLSPNGPVCGSAGIPVSFTSYNPINLNYTLNYTINGSAQPAVNVTSLPYTLPTLIPGAYKLTGFTFNNGAGTGVVDGTVVNAYADPPVADAGLDQSLCGVSGTILAGNNPAPYSGSWTIVNGAGGTFVNSTQYNTVFTGVLGQTYILRWTIRNASCASSDQVVISFPVVASTPSNFTSAPNPVCQGSVGNIYTVPDVAGYTYNWSYSGTGATINGSGNSVTINFSPTATSGTLSVTASNSCGTSSARTLAITVNAPLIATFSYTGSPFCPNALNPFPTYSGGGIAGTFSSTTGLVFANTATGEINIALSTPGIYTVTNTIAPSGGCGIVTATSSVNILAVQTWTGTVNSDWNTSGNWSCGYVPLSSTTVQIPAVANQPVLSLGPSGAVNDIILDPGTSLTVTGNQLSISGIITNNGVFTVTDATIVMNGSSSQSISTGMFTGGMVKNLYTDNSAGVTLTGPLNISGIVKVISGNLSSGGNLTLLSTTVQTALIDGSGNGNITGNVTMQRYISPGFGYKYLSSPFQAATVNEFADDITLGSFTFYRYDESRTASGWVNYNNPANTLVPMAGYAVNFGSSNSPNTLDITGVVNNGSLSLTLYNNNNTYTKGLNLVGNPYPSPINWDAVSGWSRTNIDNAVYYFKASTTDQYGGVYSSYVAGVSSDGIVNNIIPSMQGFFVHVSDGAYPVTGLLGLNNSVRITDLIHPIAKSGRSDASPLLRLAAVFSDDEKSSDPLVIYFTDKATEGFDKELDALKIYNTDLNVANLYQVAADNTKLSISALPVITGDLYTVPLGVKLNRAGDLTFRLLTTDESFNWKRIYLTDVVTGIEQDLLPDKTYTATLDKGEYINRFYLNLSEFTTGITDNPATTDKFTVYSTKGILKAEIGILNGDYGTITVFNLAGQLVFIEKVFTTGHKEFSTNLKNGIYIVHYSTGTFNTSKKLFIENR